MGQTETTKVETRAAQQTNSVAREIADYEAEIYKAKRNERAARKSFKTRLGR